MEEGGSWNGVSRSSPVVEGGGWEDGSHGDDVGEGIAGDVPWMDGGTCGEGMRDVGHRISIVTRGLDSEVLADYRMWKVLAGGRIGSGNRIGGIGSRARIDWRLGDWYSSGSPLEDDIEEPTPLQVIPRELSITQLLICFPKV
jgi:hypothetical protein